jgi:tRNA 2-thiouridine synthesizing protein A
MQMNSDLTIDAKGLNCPLPILRAKKALSTMQSGQVLEVIATDPSSERDFQDFCRQTGNTLLQQEKNGPEIRHWMKRR